MKHGDVVPSSEKPVMRNSVKKLGHDLYICIWIMHESGFDMSRISRTLGVSAVLNNFTGRQLQYRWRWSLPVYVDFFLKAGVSVRHPHAFPAGPIYHPAHSLKCLDVRSASCFPATSISVLSLHLSASRNYFSSSPTQDVLHNKICWYACFYKLKIFILFTKKLYYQNVIALLLALLSGLLMGHVSLQTSSTM